MHLTLHRWAQWVQVLSPPSARAEPLTTSIWTVLHQPEAAYAHAANATRHPLQICFSWIEPAPTLQCGPKFSARRNQW